MSWGDMRGEGGCGRGPAEPRADAVMQSEARRAHSAKVRESWYGMGQTL